MSRVDSSSRTPLMATAANIPVVVEAQPYEPEPESVYSRPYQQVQNDDLIVVTDSRGRRYLVHRDSCERPVRNDPPNPEEEWLWSLCFCCYCFFFIFIFFFMFNGGGGKMVSYVGSFVKTFWK